MDNFEATVLIDRPIEQVFDFLVDGENDKKFSARVLGIEKKTDGSSGLVRNDHLDWPQAADHQQSRRLPAQRDTLDQLDRLGFPKPLICLDHNKNGDEEQ